MIVVDDDYNDDFNVDGLFLVVNSYMHRGDVIGDECMYVKWWSFIVWIYAFFCHMFMHS